MMKRGYQFSRFTGIGCENHNENEQAKKKNITLVQNSFWMELAVLEIARKKPGRGPGGQKGQAWLLAGNVWMSRGEIADLKCAGLSPGGCWEGGDSGGSVQKAPAASTRGFPWREHLRAWPWGPHSGAPASASSAYGTRPPFIAVTVSFKQGPFTTGKSLPLLRSASH